jgi:hypothetical protein
MKLKTFLFCTIVRPIMMLRDDFTRPFDRLPLSGVVAEVGVFEGEHAEQMLLRHPSITKLYCIDPWQEYDGGRQERGLNKAYLKAKARLGKYGRLCQLYRGDSWYFANNMHPELDAVYIDGDHTAPWPVTDIGEVWPLIKPGGILGGHDFDCPDVRSAVIEHLRKTNLPAAALNVKWNDWWIEKPKEQPNHELIRRLSLNNK